MTTYTAMKNIRSRLNIAISLGRRKHNIIFEDIRVVLLFRKMFDEVYERHKNNIE